MKNDKTKSKAMKIIEHLEKIAKKKAEFKGRFKDKNRLDILGVKAPTDQWERVLFARERLEALKNA